MKHLRICLLLAVALSPCSTRGADKAAPPDPKLAEARERWLRGNYEESRELYQELLKDAKRKEAAAIGVSRTWQSTGEYAKAREAIDSALKDSPKNAALHARLAELHYLHGRLTEADKSAEQAIALQKDNFLARWVRAQIYRDRGDLKKADAEFRWFVRTYSERSDNDNDVTDPDDLLLVGLAGCENARWNQLSDQFEFILQEVWGEALKQDKNYWPARLQSGLLLLEKHNPGDALSAFEKALAINPHAAEVLVGKGNAALHKFDVKDAELFAEQALKINPKLYEALVLRADIHWAIGSVSKALTELERARAVNPRDETGLARIAAVHFVSKKNDDLEKLIQEVAKQDPKPGVFFHVLGEKLEERRRYEEAEKYFKRAIEQRPMLPGPHNSLGLLYMRMGREKEALPILQKAFDADEFNIRVSNTLTVLRHLDSYRTVKTAHFELRFDAKTDEHLGKYVARYLEEIYDELAEKFQYRPAGPILVEVFSNHEMFSGRVINLPDLHTIGACTGRMMAMVSPRGKGIRKPFNWVRVLRHELVHIFNLEQTHFLVPHWYTEGLAVSNEGFPRPQQWNQILVEKVPKGELMNLDTIDLGFIRPRSQLEWHQAYCQSQLYVEYLTEKHGKEAIGKLLAAYGEGEDTASAIQKVCRTSKADFEKGYRTYLDGVVQKLRGRPAEKPMSLKELRDEHEKDPGNIEVAARLAEQYVKRDKAQARKLADGVLAKQKNHPVASAVKAQLLLGAGDDEAALKLLEGALDAAKPEPRVLQLLGKIYFDEAQFAKAAELYEKVRKAEPHDSRWLVELVRVYAQTGERDKQIAALEALVPTDADDIDVRRQTARLLLEAGKHAQAERYARLALEIDVLDGDAELLFGEALLGQKKHEQAAEALELAGKLFEKARSLEKLDDTRVKLARAYLALGRKDEARALVEKVLARDEEHKEAREVKGILDKK